MPFVFVHVFNIKSRVSLLFSCCAINRREAKIERPHQSHLLQRVAYSPWQRLRLRPSWLQFCDLVNPKRLWLSSREVPNYAKRNTGQSCTWSQNRIGARWALSCPRCREHCTWCFPQWGMIAGCCCRWNLRACLNVFVQNWNVFHLWGLHTGTCASRNERTRSGWKYYNESIERSNTLPTRLDKWAPCMRRNMAT